MKTKRTLMTMTKPIPILVGITVFLLNQMLYSQQIPERYDFLSTKSAQSIVSDEDGSLNSDFPNEYIYFRSGSDLGNKWFTEAQFIVADDWVAATKPLQFLHGNTNWAGHGEYIMNSKSVGNLSPYGLSLFVNSKEKLRITEGDSNKSRISIMGPLNQEALVIEGGNILSGKNDGIFRGGLNIISSPLPTANYPDNSYSDWFIKNLINLEAYEDYSKVGITFSRSSTKTREWTIHRQYNSNNGSTDLVFATGLDEIKSVYKAETDERMILSANGDVTINSGGSDHLVQVSINTDAKVDHAALTVAGALYVGPQAEKASTGELDKFDQEYINDYNLWVEDGIVTEDLVLIDITDWSDHVFKEDYALPKLSEVERFIQTNGHLKNIPSEKEVKDVGYKQHDLNKGLLEKVEELTLYIIAQEKRMAQLEALLNEVKATKKNNQGHEK